MFDLDKKYWFRLATHKGGEVSVKGNVVEETPYLIRVRMDDGNETIIACARILNVNEATDDAQRR